MLPRLFALTAFVVVLLSSNSFLFRVNAATAQEIETTREEILASRERRSKQIESLLEESKQRLVDHNTGTRILGDKEKADLGKKINIYQRKLETMLATLDEREVERILKREQLRNERLKERQARRSEL